MKKILKFSLVLAAVVFTAGQAHAGSADFSLDLIKEEGKTVRFSLKETKKIDLSIYDTNDSLIYQEKVTSEDTINRTYDLTALPNGIYFLRAESDLKISKYKIEVVGSKAKLTAAAISEVYKPVLVNKNGMVTVNILNLDTVPVAVTIYDSEENEVYNENLTAALYVGKIFDLTSTQNGKYTFEITYNGKTFSETVIIK